MSYCDNREDERSYWQPREVLPTNSRPAITKRPCFRASSSGTSAVDKSLLYGHQSTSQ